MKRVKINTYALFLSFSFVFLISSGDAKAQQKSTKNTEIVFSNQEFKKVLETAKTSHKKIFVDMYATWCAPCKQLQKTSFKHTKVAVYFNKNFINVSIDIEKEEGTELAKKWKVDGLPALLILDDKGKVIANHIGYVDGEGLLEFAKEATRK